MRNCLLFLFIVLSAEKFGGVGKKSYLCGMNAVRGIMDRKRQETWQENYIP